MARGRFSDGGWVKWALRPPFAAVNQRNHIGGRRRRSDSEPETEAVKNIAHDMVGGARAALQITPVYRCNTAAL